jgi:AsmA protein
MQNVIAKSSHSNTHVNGDAHLDFKTLLLTINTMVLKANATNVLEQAGKAKTNITGDLRANLKDLLIDITAMTLAVDAQALPKIGNVQANITGHLATNLNQQQLTLQDTVIQANLTGEALSGGSLSADVSSRHLMLNPKTQQFKLEKMILNATVKGGMVPSGKLVHRSQGDIDIDLIRLKGQAHLKHILLDIAGAKLTGSAKLARLSPQPIIKGSFKTNQFTLKHVLTALGVTLPATRNANVLGDSQASFQLIATPASVKLHKITMRMDQSNITGELSVNNFQQPAIKTALKIDQWVVDDYLAPVDPKTSPKSQANDTLLPIKMMQALHLDGSVDIKKLRFDQVDFANVHASIDANNGIINAKPLRFSAYKGNYNGELTLDVTGHTPRLTMQHHIKKVRSENLLLQFYQDRYVSGAIYLNTTLSTQGNTIAMLKQNLKGSADIELLKGTIRDSKFAQNVAMATAIFEKRKINDTGEQEVTFTKLGGDWKVDQGVFSTDNMQLLSPHFLITGKGVVNLVNNQLDFKLRLTPKDKKSKLFAPIHIHGAFDNLTYGIELDVLLKAILQNDLYKKKEQMTQALLDKKAKILEKLEARKQTELQKLREKTEAAQQRLRDEQDKLKQRLQDQQLKTQQLLQDQLKKEQEKLQNKLNDNLDAQVDDATKKVTEDIQKNIEEKAKDSLQNLLKGLF